MSQTQKNRITVDIYGVQYVIIGPESPSHIRQVASLVDEKMREINSMNPSLGTNKLAVLTAINAVNDYLHLVEKVERLEEELKRVKD
ncbi:cell division protein ZapA [Bacillus tuaregi]|uniref:cell division protein ZapA n=1 Tax=Bacillus tuaregi TaxID=1816695 RepID=UPI0008F8BDAB|nr:cell division protein ZapA [Bacillus tuaregi]